MQDDRLNELTSPDLFKQNLLHFGPSGIITALVVKSTAMTVPDRTAIGSQ